MTRPLYIFDLDGTLALIEHRRHFVAAQDGSLVLAAGSPGIYRGLVKNGDGDVWVEFEGTGKWRYSATDVKFEPNWPAFFEACVNDEPNWPVITTLNRLRPNAEIWIFSGRSDAVREATTRWLHMYTALNLYDLRSEFVMMRKDGDYTADDVLKRQWYDGMLDEDKNRLVAVFDDRDRVVKMWRSMGVSCFQVAEGEF